VAAKAKGIGLLSGGLDSALACLVVREAGAEIECLHFHTGFCVTGRNRSGRHQSLSDIACALAQRMGAPLDILDISAECLPMVLEPKHGYGKNMNPCVDCRVLMLRKARERMEAGGADFVFTGEVAGQRLKSQVKKTLALIERESGLGNRLLRPLSARLLPPTEVEWRGLVDRNRLLGLSGRGRKPQYALAERYGLTGYGQPGGGYCSLTDQTYSRRLRDAVSFPLEKPFSSEDAFMLKVGRHFRLSPTVRLIIGRNAAENDILAGCSSGRWLAAAVAYTGPQALVIGEISDPYWDLIASVVARYGDGKKEGSVDIEFARGKDRRTVAASPASQSLLDAHRI